MEASAEAAVEADADGGSVVIRIAVSIIVRIVSRSIIAAIITAGPRCGTRLVCRLLIVVRADVAEGLRGTVSVHDYRVIDAERENLFRPNEGRVTAGQEHADDSGRGARACANGGAFTHF